MNLPSKTMNGLLWIFPCLLCRFACMYAEDHSVLVDEIIFYDHNRERSIPVQIYKPISESSYLPLVVINHGYGVRNTEYTFIAEPLCQQGYWVICIQHDLPGDPELPRTGNIYERRKPIWERGVQNILFAISELAKDFNQPKIILIGHSNGGDISMLFTSIHPELVEKAVSLDSLRMPFPNENSIPILSLRANDTEADAGVIPESGAVIVKLDHAQHIDMYDAGPAEIKAEILSIIDLFLKEKL
jgi:pimeloyl-ACP methyl ester carboxylesterase